MLLVVFLVDELHINLTQVLTLEREKDSREQFLSSSCDSSISLNNLAWFPDGFGPFLSLAYSGVELCDL